MSREQAIGKSKTECIQLVWVSGIIETYGVSKSREKEKLTSLDNTPTHHLFVFLEIFTIEGGIQSYVKNILQAYRSIQAQSEAEVGGAEIFLLRDRPDCDNPFDVKSLKFHYLKTKPPMLGRLRLAAALWLCLWQKRPQHVFCGHINLAPLIQFLCQPLGIPYTILTYGKEVWQPLPDSQRRALIGAAQIWTISQTFNRAERSI